MIIIENRTVPCNPRSKNYAKGTVVNVSGSTSTSTFVYTPTYDDIINTLKNGKDYITIPTILEVYGDLYSLGEVSAFGAGSGSSSGGLIQTVYGYSSLGSTFNNTTLTDTFNAYTINQLHLRLSQVELGAAVNVAVSGAGNAITGVTKNGNVLEFAKGSTFSLVGHTHDYIPLSQKGTANGVASLDANGLIISAQLPSYVDDVIEVSSYANLPTVGESGKIYVTTDTNITYRWTGTIYVEISKSLALGETSSTAYRGDLGAIAYAHSQIAGGTGVHISGTERTNWNLAYTNSHTHANKSLLDAFSQSDNDVLNHLSIVDGKLKVDIDLYSLGEVSAFGAGSGTGGSGLIQTVYGLSGLGGTYSDATLTDTFNAYTINKINSDLNSRITSLESGSAITFTTVGSGNAVTSVTKSGTSVTVTKGLTFSVDGHTHPFSSLTNIPTTLAGYGITDALLASAYTAADVLTKIKTVDGAGSGLDADYIRGYTVNTGNSPFGRIPSISSDGVMEIGKYIDMHHDNTGTFDYSTRIICQGNYQNSVSIPTATGTLALLSDNVASATKLQTARTIAGVSFDGSANISIPFANLSSIPTTLSGYGITDAYTKTYTDATYLKLTGGTLTGSLSATNYLRSDGATIWHSGNDGSGSGLDADLLDGYNSSYFLGNNSIGDIDFNTVTQSGIYRLSGAGANNPDTSWGQMLVMRGGGDTIAQLAIAYHNSLIKVRAGNPPDVGGTGTWSAWNTVAFTTSNVASATKLQTARTIWGQNFDGTGNVSGDLSNVVNITSSGVVNANRFYAGYDSGVPNSISCSMWFRSNDTTGWINETHGGGIHMTDSTYVRVYNNKAFWVDNNIVATGEITAFGASDIRLKSNIKQIDSALDFLGKVKTYKFDWNEKALSLNPLKTKKGAGVIAQEMSLLDNNFVHSIYGDYLGVDYERFIPYLIGGVNELSNKMYDYGNRLDRAEKRVAELELEVKRLSA